MNKVSQTAGILALGLGLALLCATFIQAFLILRGVRELVISGDLSSAFGVALGPLISATVRAIYLGIMGWVSSIITLRGIQLITSSKRGQETTKRFEA